MLSIGITGGMGSGKTTCCQVFELLGVPVYYADMRGKYLLQNKDSVKEKVRALFGEEMYENGILNTRKLAGMVFNNPERLKALEGIVHPAVQEDFEEFRRENYLQPYILKEAALLFESGTYQALDKIIVVDAPLEVRIQRIQKRDMMSTEGILARISKQWPDEDKLAKADHIIKNDNNHLVIPQILELHHCFSLKELIA